MDSHCEVLSFEDQWYAMELLSLALGMGTA